MRDRYGTTDIGLFFYSTLTRFNAPLPFPVSFFCISRRTPYSRHLTGFEKSFYEFDCSSLHPLCLRGFSPCISLPLRFFEYYFLFDCSTWKRFFSSHLFFLHDGSRTEIYVH